MVKFACVNRQEKCIDIHWDQYQELDAIEDWCAHNGDFEVYATAIYYRREADLVALLLRWS